MNIPTVNVKKPVPALVKLENGFYAATCKINKCPAILLINRPKYYLFHSDGSINQGDSTDFTDIDIHCKLQF